MPSRRPRRPDFRSLTDWLHASLRQRVLSGAAQPGARLATAELAREHGVSLAAVREALARLGGEGLAVRLSQRGFRVAPATAGELRDLSLGLAELDALCLRLAVRRGKAAWKKKLQAELDAARAARSDDARDDPALPPPPRLLEALLAGCELQALHRARQRLADQLARYLQLFGSGGNEAGPASGDDIGIAQAALDGDAELAAAMLAARIRRLGEALLHRLP